MKFGIMLIPVNASASDSNKSIYKETHLSESPSKMVKISIFFTNLKWRTAAILKNR